MEITYLYILTSLQLRRSKDSFVHVKKRLRDLQQAYSLLYPAKLKVVDRGKVCYKTLTTFISGKLFLGFLLGFPFCSSDCLTTVYPLEHILGGLFPSYFADTMKWKGETPPVLCPFLCFWGSGSSILFFLALALGTVLLDTKERTVREILWVWMVPGSIKTCCMLICGGCSLSKGLWPPRGWLYTINMGFRHTNSWDCVQGGKGGVNVCYCYVLLLLSTLTSAG